MPHPIPAVDSLDWGQPLQSHLASLLNPADGGINTWASRPTGLTVTDAGRTGINTTTSVLERWTGSTWEILLGTTSSVDSTFIDTVPAGWVDRGPADHMNWRRDVTPMLANGAIGPTLVPFPDGMVWMGGFHFAASYAPSNPLAGVDVPVDAQSYWYNSNNNTWGLGPLLPVPQEHFGGVAINANEFFISLGNNPVAPFRFSRATGVWTALPPAPSSIGESGVVKAGNKIFCVGGIGLEAANYAQSLGALHIYDLTSNSWSIGASHPYPAAYKFNCCLLDNNTIMTAGGNVWGSTAPWGSIASPHNKTYFYNIATNAWSLGPDMPYGSGEGGLVKVGTKVYCFPGGGIKMDMPGAYMNHWEAYPIQIYDTISGTWSLGPQMPDPRARFGTALLPNGQILIAGGCVSPPLVAPVAVGEITSGSSGPLRSCYLFDPINYRKGVRV